MDTAPRPDVSPTHAARATQRRKLHRLNTRTNEIATGGSTVLRDISNIGRTLRPRKPFDSSCSEDQARHETGSTAVSSEVLTPDLCNTTDSADLPAIDTALRALQAQVTTLRDDFNTSLAEHMDRHAAVAAELRETVRSCMDTQERDRARIEALEATSEAKSLNIRSLEHVNRALERRLELMSELVATSPLSSVPSPTTSAHASPWSRPSRPQSFIHTRQQPLHLAPLGSPDFPAVHNRRQSQPLLRNLIHSPREVSSPILEHCGSVEHARIPQLDALRGNQVPGSADTHTPGSDANARPLHARTASEAPVSVDTAYSATLPSTQASRRTSRHPSITTEFSAASDNTTPRPVLRRMRRFPSGCHRPRSLILPATTGVAASKDIARSSLPKAGPGSATEFVARRVVRRHSVSVDSVHDANLATITSREMGTRNAHARKATSVLPVDFTVRRRRGSAPARVSSTSVPNCASSETLNTTQVTTACDGFSPTTELLRPSENNMDSLLVDAVWDVPVRATDIAGSSQSSLDATAIEDTKSCESCSLSTNTPHPSSRSRARLRDSLAHLVDPLHSVLTVRARSSRDVVHAAWTVALLSDVVIAFRRWVVCVAIASFSRRCKGPAPSPQHHIHTDIRRVLALLFAAGVAMRSK